MSSLFDLSGRSVLVTGSGTDAASAVAERICASGGKADSTALSGGALHILIIIGFTKSLAREQARNNVLVNALAPLAATRMTETIRTNEKFAANMMNRIRLKRWAEPEELAGAFVFLALDAASYITGQALPVDGGMVM